MLFVHGWPVTSATWAPLLPHLAPHVTCHLIDLVGAGDSRFDRETDISLTGHVAAIKAAIDALGLDDYAVVGHDSGGMLARHAVAGDPRLRAMGLVDTEQPGRLTLRFQTFLWARHIPGFEHILAGASGKGWLKRSKWLLGDAFTDKSLLDGPFDEFFLRPLREDPDRRWACGELLRSWDTAYVHRLDEMHRQIDVPVQLVWGADDPFFPLKWAREMVDSFADAALHVVDDAKLFVHEERPAEVADALRPTLVGR